MGGISGSFFRQSRHLYVEIPPRAGALSIFDSEINRMPARLIGFRGPGEYIPKQFCSAWGVCQNEVQRVPVGIGRPQFHGQQLSDFNSSISDSDRFWRMIDRVDSDDDDIHS